MAKLSDVLVKMLREPIETLAEDAIRRGASEVQDEYDAWADGKVDEILEGLLEKLPDEVVEYAGAIAVALKPVVLDALVEGANEVIEYIWNKAQEINPSDADSAAPQIEG